MSSKFLAIAATTVASALLLTGCNSADTGGDGKPAETTEATSTQAATYDTGAYKSTPHPGWPASAGETIGPITETTLIGANTLLPYEVDNRFSRGGLPQRQSTFELFSSLFASNIREKISSLEPTYLTGFTQLANDPKTKSNAENTVARFVSPQAAEDAAKLLNDTFLAEGGSDLATGDPAPLEKVTIPGKEDILASKDERRQVQRAFFTKDEYLFFVYTSNESLDENNDPIDHGPESMDWMQEYVKAFADKQLPLIDLIPSHKTAEGYGKSDEWPNPDPNDILRYAVMKPKEVELVGTVPVTLNARLLTSNYLDKAAILKLYDNAKIDAAASAETLLLRAPNEAHADLIEATLKALDAEVEGIEPYDEPQNVPGTTCYTSPGNNATYYSCYLRYGNYVARGNLVDIKPDEDEVTTSAAPDDQKVDVKTQLSHIMAAQYLILQEAPKENSEK